MGKLEFVPETQNLFTSQQTFNIERNFIVSYVENIF